MKAVVFGEEVEVFSLRMSTTPESKNLKTRLSA